MKDNKEENLDKYKMRRESKCRPCKEEIDIKDKDKEKYSKLNKKINKEWDNNKSNKDKYSKCKKEDLVNKY